MSDQPIEPWDPTVTNNKSLSQYEQLLASLCQASSDGNTELSVFLVLRAQLDPLRPCEKRGWCRRNALMCACIGGHDHIVAILLQCSSSNNSGGEDLDRVTETRDEYGCSALDYACQFRHPKCIAVLMHAGVPLDSANSREHMIAAASMMVKIGFPRPLDHIGIAAAGEKNGRLTTLSKLNQRLEQLAYCGSPWAMGGSFAICSIFCLHHYYCEVTSTEQSGLPVYGGTGLCSLAIQAVICYLIYVTRSVGPGIWEGATGSSSRSTSTSTETGLADRFEYGPWILRECVIADAQAAPAGLKIRDVDAYKAALSGLGTRIQRHTCPVCRVWRPAGARHSSRIGKCVRGFDHYCVFFATDIGEDNLWSYLLALCGFNAVLPIVLSDIGAALLREQGEWTPRPLGVPLIAFRKLSEGTGATVYSLALALLSLWLWLLWLFVVLLLVQGCYRKVAARVTTSLSKEKKDD